MRPTLWWLRSRKRLLIAYWVVQVVIAYALLLPLFGAMTSDDFWLGTAVMLGSVGAFVLLQALYLLPVRRPRRAQKGKPLILSMLIAGLMIAALAGAIALSLWFLAYTYLGVDDERLGWVLIGVMTAAWCVSTPLLIAFSRRSTAESMLHRVASALFLGTIVEAAAIIPLDVLVRKKEDCWCWTGTYISLVACSVVGLFALGPAILIPLLAHRRRRWYAGKCEVCGYDMRGNIKADRCPECGSGWRTGSSPTSTLDVDEEEVLTQRNAEGHGEEGKKES